MIEFFQRLFSPNRNLTPEETEKRDTVLELLDRIGCATGVRTESNRNVFIRWFQCNPSGWTETTLFLGNSFAIVGVSETSTSEQFEVPFDICPQAKKVRDEIYLESQHGLCKRALKCAV